MSFDIAALDAIWLSAFADGVAPLDDLFTDDVKSDLFPGLVTEAQVGGKYVGMPIFTNSEILYYRTDLFGDRQNKADFEAKYGYPLAPPTTWEEYTDVAEFFTRDTDGDGQIDLYGTDVKGAVETEWLATVSQAGETDRWCSTRPAARSRSTTPTTWRRSTSTPACCRTRPPGAAQLDWAGAQNLFYQGQLAMMRFWGHAYTQTPDDAAVKGNIGAAPMIAGPGGIAGVPGAWYLSVPTAGTQAGRGEGVHRLRLRAQRPVDRHRRSAWSRAISAFESQDGRRRARELPGDPRDAELARDASRVRRRRSGRRS